MNLGGSRQMGLGKALLVKYPWQRFSPHPEWAAFDELKWLSLEGCRWIWSDGVKPPSDGPNTRRYFRRTFTLDGGRDIAYAHLRFAGESHIDARLNGKVAGTGWGRVIGSQFDDRARLLQPGANCLTIWVEHRPPTGNPNGLAACLEIGFADGGKLRITTDESWTCTDGEVAGWQEPGFDDRSWKPSAVLGSLGDEPWGKVAEPDPEFFGPQAAGIPGVVRIVYAPCALPLTVRNLGERRAYRASYFDPVEGARTPVAGATSDKAGDWRCPPPPGVDHDWILILEPADS